MAARFNLLNTYVNLYFMNIRCFHKMFVFYLVNKIIAVNSTKNADTKTKNFLK